MGMAAILVTWLVELNKLSFPQHPALEKKMIESINLCNLGQRSNKALDTWYSYVFLYSLSRLYVDLNSFYKIFPYKNIREQIWQTEKKVKAKWLIGTVCDCESL